MNLGVIGCGLIGGSIALSLGEKHRISVLDKSDNLEKIRAHLPQALVTDNMEKFLKDCPEVIFIAVPGSTVIEVMRSLSTGIGKETIVTDTASVKTPITRAAIEIFQRGGVFIGGHPMTGSERSGIEAAQPLLFQNSVYVLTPLKNTPQERLEVLVGILNELGARVLLISSEIHDKITAAVSHLPQILAVELTNLVDDLSNSDANYIALAAGGFRDMTRIASSNYSMWKDILLFNAQNIADTIDLLEKRLFAVSQNLKKRAIDSMEREFVQANLAREKIPRGAKGFLQSLYDLLIMVDDKPGMLFKITKSLYEKGINIKDIELVKVREGRGGVFRISFETREVMNMAAETLNNNGFTVLSRDQDQ